MSQCLVHSLAWQSWFSGWKFKTWYIVIYQVFFTQYSNNYLYCVMHPCIETSFLKNYKLIKTLKINICLKYGRTMYCKWIQYENTLQVSGKSVKNL